MRKKKGIDWKAQWEAHAPNYHDGLVHINVGGKTVLLKPGPGFGDLSHATTNLVLDLMKGRVQGKNVLDLGCGSGVLALCAAAQGANSVVGIDIDPAAIEHAKENAKLNGFEDKTHFCLVRYLADIPEESILLMNMISTEQQLAWCSLVRFQTRFTTMIASGILLEERTSYLDLIRQWGWELQSEKERDGWLGFVFVRSEESS